MKTKREIIEETKNFYSEDPSRRARSIRGGYTYLAANGNKCGFGRCETNPPKETSEAGGPESKLIGSRVKILGIKHDSLLLPEYQGHELAFWEDIQEFHDLSGYWTGTGISASGEHRYLGLLEKWA